jgi:hypothetical protein
VCDSRAQGLGGELLLANFVLTGTHSSRRYRGDFVFLRFGNACIAATDRRGIQTGSIGMRMACTALTPQRANSIPLPATFTRPTVVRRRP